MQIDVIYKVSSEYWRYINQFVRPESINLAIFNSTTESFLNKKVIWNVASRILSSGIFCIRAFPENISFLLRTIKDRNLNYFVTHFYLDAYSEQSIIYYVLAYKSELYKPQFHKLIYSETHNEIISSIINLSDFGDIVLCLGNDTLPFLDTAKSLSRQVIGITDSTPFKEIQSVRRVTV